MTNINYYDFMIDFMYILALPSPLNKAKLKVHDLYFVKYMFFLKHVHMCLTSPIQKKRKKMIVNVIMSAFFPNTLAIFSKHIFQTLLDKFSLICCSAFCRNDAIRNIATPIGDVLQHYQPANRHKATLPMHNATLRLHTIVHEPVPIRRSGYQADLILGMRYT